MAKLLYGQQVRVRVVQNGAILVEVVNIKSFSWTYRSKIVTEQHLGHVGPYKDDIFDGLAGSFEMNDDGGQAANNYLSLLQAINDKETNRVPDTVFDIVFLHAYPDAGNFLLTIPDVSWGNTDTNSPSRDTHTTVKFMFETGKALRVVPVT